jgi:GrpB-like predicted nucleotidyltransferase (UPF0157 family)
MRACHRILRFEPVVTRIEHFDGTAVPGMAGKPIVDLLVAVWHDHLQTFVAGG